MKNRPETTILQRLNTAEQRRIEQLAEQQVEANRKLNYENSMESQIAGAATLLRSRMLEMNERGSKRGFIARAMGRKSLALTTGQEIVTIPETAVKTRNPGLKLKMPARHFFNIYIETPLLMATELEPEEGKRFIEGWTFRIPISTRSGMYTFAIREKAVEIYKVTEELESHEREAEKQYAIFADTGRVFVIQDGIIDLLLGEAESTQLEVLGLMNQAIQELKTK